MRLSIITINYNNAQNTLALLDSLEKQTDKEFDVYVVDNASEESDFNFLKRGIGDIALIRNDRNLGFSGGNNIGIEEALKSGANWVFLLNNDTWVESDFIARLRAILSEKRGILGVPLVEDGSIVYCGRLKWLQPTLLHVRKPLVSDPLPHSFDYYAIGGAVVIHREIFDKIGMLDENYFLYFEDADFSLRAERAGFKLTFLKELKVNHRVSATTKKLGSPLLLRYHYRNALYFNFKHGPWYIRLLIWPWSLLVIAKQFLKIALNMHIKESSAIVAGVSDWYKGKMGEIKTGISQ